MTTTRRTFLGSVAAGTLVMASRTSAAESDKLLSIAVIGVGGYGMTDARAALKVGGVEIAAVCDVDSQHLKAAADELERLQGKRPREFKLHRELLDLDGLNAVIIATPPQWHALQLIDALQKGLDIYCEKPLAYDIREGQAMVDAVRGTDRIVQIGFQRRQSKAFQQAKAFIESGQAGRIVQADVQIHYRAGTTDAAPQAPPSTLDWDLWCGPAPSDRTALKLAISIGGWNRPPGTVIWSIGESTISTRYGEYSTSRRRNVSRPTEASISSTA